MLANDGRAATGATLSRAQLSATPILVGGAAGPVPASPTAGSATCVASGTERGRCTYRSAVGFTGVDVFDYALQGAAGTWNVRVTVTVTPLNGAPVARADRLVATIGGPAVTLDPRANDTDADGDALAVTGAVPPGGIPGSFACAADLCTYRPPVSGAAGSFAVAYSITDRPAAPATGIVGVVHDHGVPGSRAARAPRVHAPGRRDARRLHRQLDLDDHRDLGDRELRRRAARHRRRVGRDPRRDRPPRRAPRRGHRPGRLDHGRPPRRRRDDVLGRPARRVPLLPVARASRPAALGRHPERPSSAVAQPAAVSAAGC
ncbi:Ig-like domain-containing protein [Clavibacter zhangzhiyongii]|uniref:Ig-like domain-containing protein n=1 Tax=Clavibacter zhangzhiyongii TaxID=2768071 RepID=UPI0039E1CAAB